MILPKILIYKERFSLDEFHVDRPGGNKELFDTLRKCKDVVWDYNGDLEGQYLSIFNAAYYISVDMMASEHSYLKVKDYCDYVERNVRGHHRKVEAVLCMVRALTLGHQSASFKQGLKDVLHEKMGEFYNNFFTLLPATYTHNPVTPLFSPEFSYSPVLTYSYLEQHREEMEWKKWTNGFAEREVHEMVWKAGKSKEERLNLLDAILEDAKRNGCKNVEVKFSSLRAELEGLADSPLGYLFRKKQDLPAEPAPSPRQEDTSIRRFQELEDEIASLKARVKELEEENKCLQEECNRKGMRIHDMEIMVSVFEKMVPNINIFHTEKADQINGVVESGAKVMYQEVKSVNKETTQITEEIMGNAIEKAKAYFWAQSSWAVVFCVWRDHLDMPDNMTKFEKYINNLPILQNFPYPCPSGTVQRTISNNQFMKLPIDKWNVDKDNERCIVLAKNLMASFDEETRNF